MLKFIASENTDSDKEKDDEDGLIEKVDIDSDVNEEDIKYQKALKARPFVIRANSTIKFYWDIIIIVCAIYTSFTLPFFVCFKPEVSLFSYIIFKILQIYEKDKTFHYISLAINIIFIFDVILQFRTTYVNP
jgi:hypothetical protein